MNDEALVLEPKPLSPAEIADQARVVDDVFAYVNVVFADRTPWERAQLLASLVTQRALRSTIELLHREELDEEVSAIFVGIGSALAATLTQFKLPPNIEAQLMNNLLRGYTMARTGLHEHPPNPTSYQ